VQSHDRDVERADTQVSQHKLYAHSFCLNEHLLAFLIIRAGNPLPLPIPLHCRYSPTTLGTGTGFVVRSGDAHWLATCAHLITALKATPADPALFQNKELRVVGLPLRIPIFTSDAGRVRLSKDDSDGTFWDVISLRLTPQEAFALERFGAYDAASIIEAQIGDEVSVSGFPGLGLASDSHSTLNAALINVVGATFALSEPLEPGFSGSPVVRGSHLVGIAFGDQGFAPNLTSGLVLALRLFAPHHFAQ